jgi:hypothetical protein
MINIFMYYYFLKFLQNLRLHTKNNYYLIKIYLQIINFHIIPQNLTLAFYILCGLKNHENRIYLQFIGYRLKDGQD